MATIAGLLKTLARHRDDLRRIAGAQLSKGTPLVHLRCIRCHGPVLATIEQGEEGLQTYWRRRRFPGVPYLDCDEHGRLIMDPKKVGKKVREARRAERPITMRLRPGRSS